MSASANGGAPADPAIVAERLDWLSFHRLWGQLDRESLEALAAALEPMALPADATIYEAGQQPRGVYWLEWGSVEISRPSPIGRAHICYRSAGELFGYAPVVAGDRGATYRAGAQTRSASRLWYLARDRAAALMAAHPAIGGVLNQLLARDLAHFAQRIACEQERVQGLQPYLKPLPEGEPVGTSKPSQKLRQQAEAAASDGRAVLLQSPPGAGKTFWAGWIHGRSPQRDRPFAELDCADLPRDAAGALQTEALFGRAGGEPGAIALLERGTLLVDNVHLLGPGDRARLAAYLRSGYLTPNPAGHAGAGNAGAGNAGAGNAGSGNAGSGRPAARAAWVRLVLAAPEAIALPDLDPKAVWRLKLFSLPQRKADIPAFAAAFVERFCRQRGRSPLGLDPADLRRLVSYDYPGNLAELAGILQRAIAMTPPEAETVPEQVLWSVESAKNAFRIDLLEQYPWLRRFLLSDWWPERFWWLMMAAFVPVTVAGFVGPQTRDASITLNLFWAWWWPVYLFLFVFVGRLWCAVCPFMICGEWFRALSLKLWPRSLLPWPTAWMNRWGAWLLFAGFLVIYLWEKLWDLPHRAYLSSWLLVAIAAGAVIFSAIYERRLWCRYLCPIGGMNGMFAKLAAIELRSVQQVCGSQCHTFGCYRGGDRATPTFAGALPTEGQATDGCPLYSHPAQLQDNRDCVLCATCLKACPHRSVELNFRFPAADLLERHRGFAAEVALLMLLLGGVFMHRGDRLLAALGLPPWPLDSEHLAIALPVVLGLLALPFAATFLVHQLARGLERLAGATATLPDYTAMAYAYLPLTLAANLAYYVPAAFEEAGRALPVAARTVGLDGAGWPTLTWSPEVSQFLQGVTLLSALVFGLFPLAKIARRSPWGVALHLLLQGILAAIFYRLSA